MNSKSKLSKDKLGDGWEDRFWDKVDKCGEDECWEWNACTTSGYGRLKIKGECYSAHRLSWVLENKKQIPEETQICHTCDNRKCVNPNHLFLGDASENMKDAYEKGRISHVNNLYEYSNNVQGEEVGTSKIKRIEAKQIKFLLKYTNLTNITIGDWFNVGRTAISKIKVGRTWEHVKI